ncbi:hypothetical protein [Micromonospora yangpuensis]|uniref:hypothetical protein n=1 Tax=Micromonospora yangpuensis TaxID=683228 RepID=UPI0011130225|nr:hypothetical protein [Micromonospora yangpuensis]
MANAGATVCVGTLVQRPDGTALDLTWATDFGADQRLGGCLALAIGEACMLVLLALLLLRWGLTGGNPHDLAHPAAAGTMQSPATVALVHRSIMPAGEEKSVTSGAPDDDEVGRFDRDVTSGGRGNN